MATATYELCDAYIERAGSLDPVTATSRGLVGHDAAMTDYSPDGIAAHTELDRTTLSQLEAVRPDDDRDRVAAELLAESLRASLSLDGAGETLGALRIIGSPFQAIRAVFDVMPRSSEEEWATIAARLEGVPDAMAGLRTALAEAAGPGPASRSPPGPRLRRTGIDVDGTGRAPALFRAAGGRVSRR